MALLKVITVRQKVASNFVSQGRVFIVGDACHTHSPQAGVYFLLRREES